MRRVIFSIVLIFSLYYGNVVRIGATDMTGGTAGDIVINGHDLRKTVDCTGNDVVVEANDSIITVRGECKELRVNGSTNTITISTVASIVLNSADNTVRWKKAAKGNKPTVVDRSTGNKVEQVK
jgi:hypothetical protein